MLDKIFKKQNNKSDNFEDNSDDTVCQENSSLQINNTVDKLPILDSNEDVIQRLIAANKNLKSLLDDKSLEIQNLQKKLMENEINLKKQLELLASKENLLREQNQELSFNKEELTDYINKLFEQQERERIIKWIVGSIRESLDLDKVLETTVKEIGKLLKVDRCLIALFDPENKKFNLKNEYKINEDICSVLEEIKTLVLPDNWNKILIEKNEPVIINNRKDRQEFFGARSLVIIPIVDKIEILGIITVHQVYYQRDWKESHIEILKDISSQIAIAIRQADLYAKSQETSRLKSDFLAIMSHEFRTPLNAIIGFSEMLESGNYGQLTNKQMEYLNNISISGKHLLRLVNDVLDLSKVESGSMELIYEKFCLSQVINETVSILKSMAIKKNINISLEVCNVILNADSKRFRQIMYNLVSNAIKFTGDNGTVNIETSIIDNQLKVEVEDTGIGIPEKDRDKIFTQFGQLDSLYTRKQEGTGLGLALAKKFVELHKGTIGFESEEGKGTKFWFIIPGVEETNSNLKKKQC